jgi:hypothetical protein
MCVVIEDIAWPVFDSEDVKLAGWDAGLSGDDFVLQAGRCGDHFALVLPPGAYIVNDGDGNVRMAGGTFMGTCIGPHDPDCPTAKGGPGWTAAP